MHALKLLKIAVLTLVILGLQEVYAAELISLGVVDEITVDTRLVFNFKAHEFSSLLPVETVKTNPSKLEELRKKLLERDLGPLTLNLNLNSPMQLSRNTLSFNLDLVESFDLLRSAKFLRSPFDGGALSLI